MPDLETILPEPVAHEMTVDEVDEHGMLGMSLAARGPSTYKAFETADGGSRFGWLRDPRGLSISTEEAADPATRARPSGPLWWAFRLARTAEGSWRPRTVVQYSSEKDARAWCAVQWARAEGARVNTT